MERVPTKLWVEPLFVRGLAGFRIDYSIALDFRAPHLFRETQAQNC